MFFIAAHSFGNHNNDCISEDNTSAEFNGWLILLGGIIFFFGHHHVQRFCRDIIDYRSASCILQTTGFVILSSMGLHTPNLHFTDTAICCRIILMGLFNILCHRVRSSTYQVDCTFSHTFACFMILVMIVCIRSFECFLCQVFPAISSTFSYTSDVFIPLPTHWWFVPDHDPSKHWWFLDIVAHICACRFYHPKRFV